MIFGIKKLLNMYLVNPTSYFEVRFMMQLQQLGFFVVFFCKCK